MKQAFVIVDLDGTFVSCNSFHLWIHFMWRRSVVALPLTTTLVMSFTFFKLFFLRKLSIISHSRLKREIQCVWSALIPDDKKRPLLDDFNDKLTRFVPQNIFDELVHLRKRGSKIILATAAPSEYADPFSKRFDFFHGCLSTPGACDPAWYDNIRERKRDCVIQNLANDVNEADEIVLFTDHQDDLPLVCLCDTIYVFNPLCTQIDRLRRQYAQKKFIQLV